MAVPGELHASGATELARVASVRRRLQPFPDGSRGYPPESSFIYLVLLEQALSMTQILRELVAGVAAEHLRRRAARVLERIDGG
jgi:hypothetical protein